MDSEGIRPMVEIESLREGREGGSFIPGCRLVLSDGSTYFILLSDSDRFGCRAGLEVDGAFREELKRAHLRREICAKALDLVALRDHARQELRLKLEKRFLYPGKKGGSVPASGVMDSETRRERASVIGEVLDLLEERRYLDDTRFAEGWAASRLRKHPEGRTALIAGLRARGVSGETAGRIATGLDDEGAFFDALDRACKKLSTGRTVTEEKFLRRLTARGFSYREIKGWLFEHPGLFDDGTDQE